MKTMEVYILRVKPEEELAGSITEYCKSKQISSAIVTGIIGSAIVTGIIGSLASVRLGFLQALPGKYIAKDFPGPLEIVAAQGTVAMCDDELVLHVHILVSDENRAVGGHLIEAAVFSTAEVVIEQLDEQITRKFDDYTGLKELKN